MKSIVKNFLIFISVLLLSLQTQAYVTKSGNVSGEYWHNMDTYYVDGTLIVDAGTTFEIQAGTIVKFAPGTGISCSGTLIAHGNSGANIIFTSRDEDSIGEIIFESDGDPDAGEWLGIYLNGSSTNEGIGEFNYCRLRYGGNYTGQADANIYFYQSDNGYFNNSYCEYSSEDGLRASYTSIDISGSTFLNNNDYAANLEDMTSIKNYPENTASGNGINVFGVYGTVDQNLTWTSSLSSVILSLTGEVRVNDEIVCTIQEGTIIKSESQGYFRVFGSLDVNGTGSNPVVITSLKDDTYGGDSNNDGSATLPAPGDWQGIYLYGDGDNNGIGEFDYCRVRYGGNYSGLADANIYFNESDNGYFNNSYSEYSSEDGVKAYYTSIDISGSTFLNNNSYAANLESMTSIDNYPGNSVSGNGIDAFGIYGYVDQNITWTSTLSSVILSLTGEVRVYDEIVCTIQEGTIIKSESQGYFRVFGSLDVNGTVANPVVITSLKDDTYGGDSNNDGSASLPAPGDWQGIYLYGDGDNNGIGEFDYCRVRYGGNYSGLADANIYFNESDNGYFNNSYSEYSSEDGVKAYYTSIDISGSTFLNNNDYAANLVNIPSITNYPGNSANGNGIDAFGIYGNVDQNLTWTSSISSVILSLTGEVRVFDEIVCTIPEGTIIKSGSQGNFRVFGSLDVNGTISSPVVITSLKDDTYGGDSNNDGSATLPAPGDWQGIYLYGAGDDNGIGEFDYCRIRYGGNFNGLADANIYFDQSDGGYFNDSYCEYSYQNGLRARITDINIQNSSFENNLHHAAFLENITIRNYPGNAASANGYDAFAINGNVTEDMTWTESTSSVILKLREDVFVENNVVLSFNPGTIVKAENYGEFYVYGTLDVNGTQAEPVVFTSDLDDTWGGDSNNDGNATSPAPGDWGGIYFRGNDDFQGIGEFDFCRIRYGGYNTGAADANVYFDQSDGGYFNDSYCEYSYQNGLRARITDIDIQNSSFENNLQHAAFLENMTIRNYPGNSASANGYDAFAINGNVTENMTWTETSSSVIMLVREDVFVDTNVVLTFNPGTIVKAENYGQFYVYGTLDVNGTQAEPVVFTSDLDDTWGGDSNNDGNATSPAPGDWSGIYFRGNDDFQGIGEFDFCRIRYGGYTAGSSNANIYFDQSDGGYFNDSYCEYSYQNGLRARITDINIQNSSFENNLHHAAFLENITIRNYPGNAASANGYDAFAINGNVTEDMTWTESTSSVILKLREDVFVENNVVLSFNPGTIVKAENYGEFYVYGTLDVNGTQAEPVVFTSDLDDTWGGDSNNDADATTPSPGDWGGIYLNGLNDLQGIGQFDFCRLRYGGYGSGAADANIRFRDSDEGHFYNSIAELSAQSGITTVGAFPKIRHSTFAENGAAGLIISGDTIPDLGHNSLTDGGFNIFINNDGGTYQMSNQTADEIPAYYNDWGYYTALEIDAQIYDDNENTSYGEVLFNPWYDPANPPLEANFGADTLYGEAPLMVQFTDSTLLSPTGWEWDFENDGNVDATDQHPEWTYFDGGLYSVKLTATSGTSSDTFIRNDYIDVTPNQHLRSYALDFDGTDDYLELTNVVYPESFTLEAWIKPENLDNVQEIVYLYGEHSVQFRLDPGGVIMLGEYNGVDWNYVNSQPGVVYLNQWNHIAVTKDVDHVNLYVNGVNVDNEVFDNDPIVETMHIGGRGSLGDRFFEGYIDEVRIWTSVLTQSEIQSNMTNYLAGTEPGLMAYYRMNDVMGQVAYDFTGYDSDLQLGSTTDPDANDPVWTQTNWPYDTYLLADFSADPTIGTGPLTVQFTDMSMNVPSTWEWDFDSDGIFDSFDQNPQHTFEILGTHTVKLVVTDAKGSDTIVKENLITVEGTQVLTIAEARLQPMGTMVTVTGIVTCGTEYGNLHFIQDATAGMALYSADLNYFRMGDEVEVTGELTDYNGLMEMVSFTSHYVISTGNPMPEAQTIAIGDLGEAYESEIVRIDDVTFSDGGNQFASYINYNFSDVSGTTYTRLHDNTDLKNQVIPNYPVSYVGICAQIDGNPTMPYCIYPRDYNDLVYTNIPGFEQQSTSFTKRYNMVNSVWAVDENIVWATAQNEKDYPTLNEITRTTDGGLTWETIQIPNTEGLVKSSIYAFDENMAWVTAYKIYGTNPQGVYATTDGGTSWTHQSTAAFDVNNGFPNFVHFWDPAHGVCMGDPTNGYFEIYTTENGGLNWTRVDQGAIPAPLADEVGIVDHFSVQGDDVWFTTNKGRVFTSHNMGAYWMAQQTPIAGACIAEFKNPGEGLVISTGNNEIYRTYNGGNSWEPVAFSGMLRSYDLKYVPGSSGTYVATEISGGDAGISYTLDDGETWISMDYTYGVHFGAMDWVNSTTGFIGANNFDEYEGGMWKYTGSDLVEYSVSWSPEFPTTDETVTITVTGVSEGAWLHWGVNFWQTPDMAYWPPNTEPFPGGGPAVQTVMNGPDGNNELTIELGPFNDPVQSIDQVNFVIHYFDETWDNNNGNDYHISIIGNSDPTVDLKVMLEGPYNPNTKLMETDLNDQGYLPLDQPYNPGLPYYNESNPVWWYDGTESVVSITNNVVDWVIVQFRDANSAEEATSATIIQEQAAFVLFSGHIVDLDGSSPLTLTAAFSNNLYAVVLHRNHLGVISAMPLTEFAGNYSYDFTTGQEQAYGGLNGHKFLSDGIWGMVSADGSGNGLIQNTDETTVWKMDLGQSGYKGGDFDMNGLVQNTDETNYWKVNLGAGGQTPGKSNKTGYQSQVPK